LVALSPWHLCDLLPGGSAVFIFYISGCVPLIHLICCRNSRGTAFVLVLFPSLGAGILMNFQSVLYYVDSNNKSDHEHAEGRVEAIPFEHRLMTKRELAGYFRITERTVEAWMQRRQIPYLKIGRTVRFRLATVVPYVNSKYLIPALQSPHQQP